MKSPIDSNDPTYYELNPEHTQPERIKKEREKARKLRKTQWWLDQLNRGICHYCGKSFPGGKLTMDHVVPLARGGESSRGNIVAACAECNRDKKLETPVDKIMATWGEDQTRFFFELTPDRVLEAVEASGLRCTGRCAALNSFENRVYDVELEMDKDAPNAAEQRAHALNRRVVKFYRPGRWTREQILEEHEFLQQLVAAEIPAIAPLPFPSGETVRDTPVGGIISAIFPKVGGRAPDELTDDQLLRIGRLLARIHNVGASKPAQHRMKLTPDSYGISNLEFLLKGDWIPIDYRARYETAVRAICELVDPWFLETPAQRVHGDCHLGNLLWNNQGPFFLDFDDMVIAPPVQDVWMLVPGREDEDKRQRSVLLEGYEEMRTFDHTSLRLIEPLRALRFVHYTAWVARRWQDPAFPLAFPQFGSHRYWSDETDDLEEQLRMIQALGQMDGRPGASESGNYV